MTQPKTLTPGQAARVEQYRLVEYRGGLLVRTVDGEGNPGELFLPPSRCLVCRNRRLRLVGQP
jgi:hypothetical protein